MNKRLEAETREAIIANRRLLRDGIAVVWTVKALKILQRKLADAELPFEPYEAGGPCKHVWGTQDEALGATYCFACGEPDMVKLAQDTMDRCCPPTDEEAAR